MCVLVAQSCLNLCDSMDCSPPGSSIHGILQARILEWVAISFSKGSPWPRDQTWVSCTAGRVFAFWATREDIRWLQALKTSVFLKWLSSLLPTVQWQILQEYLMVLFSNCHLPRITKPKVFPSLCNVTSTVRKITLDPWTAKNRKKRGK